MVFKVSFIHKAFILENITTENDVVDNAKMQGLGEKRLGYAGIYSPVVKPEFWEGGGGVGKKFLVEKPSNFKYFFHLGHFCLTRRG